MDASGQFTGRPAAPTWPLKLAMGAILVALVAAGLLVGALALWLAFWLLPVAIGAAVIGWLALRFQIWRLRRGGAPPGPWRGGQV